MPTEEHYLEIRDGVVALIQRVTVREVAEEEFAKNLSNSVALDSGILQPGALYFARRAQIGVYVLQQEPKEWHLTWNPNRRPSTFKIPLPWLQWYGVYINGALRHIHLTCSNIAVVDEHQYVGLPPLPNIYHDQARICMGEINIDNHPNQWERLKRTADGIMNSQWNHDLQPDWNGLGLMKMRELEAAQNANNESNVMLAYGLGLMAKMYKDGHKFWEGPTERNPVIKPVRGAGNESSVSSICRMIVEREGRR